MNIPAWIHRHRSSLRRIGFVATAVLLAIVAGGLVEQPDTAGAEAGDHDGSAVADRTESGVGGSYVDEDPAPPGFFPNPLKWLNFYLIKGFVNLVRALLTSTVTFAWDLSTLASDMQDTVNHITIASYVVFVMVAGLIVLSYQTLQSQHGAAQLLPRLVIGLAAASLGPWIVNQVADIANAVVEALSDTKESAVDDVLKDAADDNADLTSLVLVAVAFCVMAVVLFDSVTRMTVMLMLYVFAPAALACHALPYTEGIALVWWRMLAATVASAMGQAAMLTLWFYVTTGNEKLRMGWSGQSPSATWSIEQFFQMMLIIVFGFAVHKIHVRVYRWAGKPAGRGGVKALVAAVVMQVVHPSRLLAAAAGAKTRHSGGHGGGAYRQPSLPTGQTTGHAPAGGHQPMRRAELDAWAQRTPTGWNDGYPDKPGTDVDPQRATRPRVNAEAIDRADPHTVQDRRPATSAPAGPQRQLNVKRHRPDGSTADRWVAPPQLPTYPRRVPAHTTVAPRATAKPAPEPGSGWRMPPPHTPTPYRATGNDTNGNEGQG